ncbi:UNVERIFIED_CONTAM: hypothetical protein PYX00_009623 [Menopon gallinae]|uniref:Sodium/nucleoside cotransporter n=1 Tax=Menopon gallinae TaxID=328185 RepID=A0AAW2HBT1_9NEOP
MNGRENLAYSKDDPKQDEKTRSETDIELRVENRLEEQGPSRDVEKKSDDRIDICSRTVVAVRSSIYEFFNKRERFFKRLFYVAIHGVLIAYLAAATVIYKSKDSETPFWKGYGLLIVLYCLIYGGLFYCVILKRFFLPKVRDTAWKPVKSVLQGWWKVKALRWICYALPVCALVAYVALELSNCPKKIQSLLGLLTFVVFGFLFSESPGHINWRPVYTGFILQFVFGLLAIKWSVGRAVLQEVGDQVSAFLKYTDFGTAFVYGPLVSQDFIAMFKDIVFAFSVLPVIFFFAFFVNILSYYNILQWFILKLAWIVQTVMGTTVCESVNAAASIFLGLTESILLIKDHLKDLTRSEIHAVMCEGLATVAGTVLAAYISFGIRASHLIGASVMSAPAALSYAKLFYPEKEESKTSLKNIVLTKEEASNVLDAATKGAITAISLVAGIIANIIAFLAFVAFLDGVLTWFGSLLDHSEINFQYLLTKLFIPVSYLMGVDDDSIEDVALLVGTKTFVNEFQAYKLMSNIKHKFTPRTEAIATYALCGFSNFGSIGILVGGFSALAPSKTADATAVAMRAFIAGNIVCFVTACVAGILLDV